jgi:hypothetical protein
VVFFRIFVVAGLQPVLFVSFVVAQLAALISARDFAREDLAVKQNRLAVAVRSRELDGGASLSPGFTRPDFISSGGAVAKW